MPAAKLVPRVRSQLGKLAKSEVGLGTFDPGLDSSKLQIQMVASRIRNAAPELSQFISALMARKVYYDGRDHSSNDYDGAFVMLCSILVHSYTLRLSSNFAVVPVSDVYGCQTSNNRGSL